MMLARPPVPPVPITEDGKRVSREWWRWFHDLFVDEQSTGNLTDLAAQVAPPDPPSVGDAEIILRSVPGDSPAFTDDISVLRSIPGDPSCDCEDVRLLTLFSSLATPQGGVWTTAQGGTGQTFYTDGQLLIGDSLTSGLDKATLTAGTGVSIVNGHGTITISATGSGGTVTSISAGTGITATPNPITGTGTIALTNSSVTINSHALSLGGTLTLAFSDFAGTVAATQLPNPSATTLGGIESAAAVSHQWIDSISTLGVPHLSQPAFTDISGTIAAGQISAGEITNAMLANSTLTLGSTVLTLGATTTTVSGLTLSSPTLTGQMALPTNGFLDNRLFLGFNNSVSSNPQIQNVSTGACVISNIRFSADGSDALWRSGKSRGTTSLAGAVVSGDALGEFNFVGDDGSTNGLITVSAATMRVLVDGTVSTGIVPSYFSFQTMNTGGTIAERVRLRASGCFNVGNTTDLGSGTVNGHSGVYAAETIIPPTNVMQSTSSNPTGTTNTTGVMMGLAKSFTPKATVGSGSILINVTGDCFNATAIADGGKIQIRTGTGTAPINGAALTGTAVGSLVTYIQATTADKYPFSLSAIVTGLVLGTAIWIDVSLAAVTGGTATIENVSVCAVEV